MEELKEYIKTARIYYKIAGSDKIHTITPLTYDLLKGEVFHLRPGSKSIYIIEDNISYIHFYNSLGETTIYNIDIIKTASPNTKVVITMDSKKSYNFLVSARDVTIKNKENDEDMFSAEIKDAYQLKYIKGEEFEVSRAKKTILQGNPMVYYLKVSSSFLKVSDLSERISYFEHSGDEINLNNVNCDLLAFETDAKAIVVQNSNIKKSGCRFNNCIKPVFVNSTWEVLTSLYYVDGRIGNRETGITITDETFSNESLMLARAYATYRLKEFLNNVKANNEADISPKLEVLDEAKRALKEKYDRQIATLEAKKDVIINGYQKRKVKNLVKKKEN